MLRQIDNFLDNITMYRLVVYYLLALLGIGFLLSIFGVLAFSPVALAVTTLLILLTSLVTNAIFARTFKVTANVESAYITAFILALIITPTLSVTGLIFMFWAAVLAMATKYIVTFRHKHIFNPAALAVAITAFTINQSASWWVGAAALLPFVAIGGLLVVRKIQRGALVVPFLIGAFLTMTVMGIIAGTPLITLWRHALLDSSLFFFAFIMLTEPLTTPPTKNLQLVYGALTGVLFAPQVHFGAVYSTPELALLVGNVFTFLVSPKGRLQLRLLQKQTFGSDIINYVFSINRRLNFQPGQYLEWTLPVSRSDSRGNRRYFTIASSPTESEMMLGVKFYPKPSAFKRSLLQFKTGDTILASQLSGNFVLPADQRQKLAFIAGGIGITPFRSMIKYLSDTNQRRDVVLFYSNKLATEIAYTDVFAEASQKLGLQTVYNLTTVDSVPQGWPGRVGPITPALIRETLPDYLERVFYLSGPHGMVTAFEDTLKQMGVPRHQIKIDYFPGFA